MNLILTSLLALALSGAEAAQDSVPEQPVTPTAQYQALLKEFNLAANGYWNATTIDQKKKLTAGVVVLTPKLLNIAERNPSDPVAFDVLVQTLVQTLWLQNNTPYAGGEADSVERRAIAILLRDHLQSDRLAQACDRIGYGFRRECEAFLRTALRESPHREVRGIALLMLAQLLHGRSQRLLLLQSRPDRALRYEKMFGKQYLDGLRRRKPADAVREFVALFERAAEEYGDVKTRSGVTIAEQAQTDLYEIRRLAVGKSAVEIQGEDQDGVRFKLSDYRGKVVLLYFWQHT